jgi:P pilus assembly chaperone PapD
MPGRFMPLLISGGLLALSASIAGADVSLDLSPVRIEVKADAGAEYTHSIQVQNTGSDSMRVRVSIEDWKLDLEGTPVFLPAGTMPRTASGWITAAPGDFLLDPGQTQFVRFTLKVPEGVPPAGYWSSLVVESIPIDRSSVPGHRMFLRGRIGCMLYVSVGTPARSAEITSLTTVRKSGRTWIEMDIDNPGLDFVRLSGEVTGLSGDDIVSLARVPDVPVLPGSRRHVEILIPENLSQRDDVARVTLDLDGVGPVLAGKK